jgi:hypothetical protein
MTDPQQLAAKLSAAQRRDYRGRFLCKVKMTPPGAREWLLWSKYHRAWHCRSEDGQACGYTTDLSRAGRFEREKALQYNSDRDKPVHVSALKRILESEQSDGR